MTSQGSVSGPRSRVSANDSFSNAGLTTSVTTRYLTRGYEGVNAPINPADVLVSEPFVVAEMRYGTRAAGAGGGILVFGLRKNGVVADTLTLVNTSVTGGPGTTKSVSVSYAPGDTYGVQVDKTGVHTGSPADPSITLGERF